MRKFIVIALLTFIETACVGNTPKTDGVGNPTATEILSKNSEADIFQYNDLIYSNASSIEWVKDKEYQKGKQISEIRKQSTNSGKFNNGTASQLQKGTKVFQTIGEGLSILIIDKNGENLIYIALIEG